MINFKAIANEPLPANRLVVLTINGKEEDEIRIRLANKGEIPDFVSSRDIQENEEIYVQIKNKQVWTVVASEDIRAGVSVGTNEEGKLVEALSEENHPIIGYSLHSAKADQVVKYVRNVKGV